LPFYHLKSNGFWHLPTLPGKEIALISSHSIKKLVGYIVVVSKSVCVTQTFWKVMSNSRPLQNERLKFLNIFLLKKIVFQQMIVFIDIVSCFFSLIASF